MTDWKLTHNLSHGYLYLNGKDEPNSVFRTVLATRSLLVDLDEDGRVLGIENLAGPVDVEALGAVLRQILVKDVAS